MLNSLNLYLATLTLKPAVETMVLPDLSLVEIVLLTAIAAFIAIYVTVLLRLKPSTENTTSGEPQEKLPTEEEEAMPPATTETESSIEEQKRPEKPVVLKEASKPEVFVKIVEEPPKLIETPTTKPVKPTKITKPTKSAKTPESEKETLPPTRPSECPHFFGYLRKFPKNLAIPDECLGCLRIMECLHMSPAPE